MTFKIDKSSWDITKFGDVVENTNRTIKNPIESGIDKFIGLEHLDSGDLRIKRFGNTVDGVTFTKLVSPGQTLFGKRRAYQKKVAFVEFDAVCSGDILAFSPRQDMLTKEFLPFVVTSEGFFNTALSTSAGSLSPRTRWSDLAKFEFLLPPLEEQKRIAELFWKLESHSRELQNLKEILKSGLRELLLSEIRDSNFAESVEVDSLDSFLNVTGGGTPSTKKSEFWNGNIPWVTPVDLTKLAGKCIADSEKKITNLGVQNSSAKLIPIGSVLMSTRGTVGATAINTIPVTTNQSIESLVPGPRLRVEFLLVWIEANMNLIMSRSSGSTFAAITNSRLRSLPVHLPPRKFQDAFLKRWNALDRAICNVDSEVVNSRILSRAIQEELVG